MKGIDLYLGKRESDRIASSYLYTHTHTHTHTTTTTPVSVHCKNINADYDKLSYNPSMKLRVFFTHNFV